ncbi:MAG: hypothetical protein JWP11_1022 [Frankiales bacterium]|nr:hypothetical protein [Frankiales bacterium]
MSRLADLALACYPPSWKERYGDELADLAGDGDGADLIVGAARAWLHPAGTRTIAARRQSAISTVHVSWCAVFVAGLVYLKAVNDPPLPGLTTGASQPLWAVAKLTFFAGWGLLLLGGTGLLLRIAFPALRVRNWPVLRPMVPAAVLLVAVLGGIPLLGRYDNAAGVTAVLVWLALGLALVVMGAVGPVVALRRSGLSVARWPVVVAAGVTVMAVGLAAATAAQAAVLTDRVDAYNFTIMWGSVVVLVAAAATSTVSVGRALRRS